uniref:PTPRJ transmembrane domain-containing protein n=1 Tax=Ciona savignyi TaxID=51511 RepID=H2YIJ2_CIOSA
MTGITIILPANTFNDKNGPIQFYAVYVVKVAQKRTDTQPDLTRNVSCTPSMDECVAAWYNEQGVANVPSTRKKRSYDNPVPNPELTFTVGDGTITRSPWNQNFPNQPLAADTEYVVAIAAKTGNDQLVSTNWSTPIRTVLTPLSAPNVGLIAGLTVACIVIVILIIGLVYLYLKRRKDRKKDDSATTLSNPHAIDMERRQRKKTKVVQLSEFLDVLKVMKADSDFKF